MSVRPKEMLSPMRFRLLIPLVVSFAVVGSAMAADTPKAGGESNYVDLSAVGLPVVTHGRLVNYVFVIARLKLASAAFAAAARDKEPYLRDALVRLGHRTPLNPPNDLNSIDPAAVRTCLMAESARLIGPRAVTNVLVVSETAQRRLPRPG